MSAADRIRGRAAWHWHAQGEPGTWEQVAWALAARMQFHAYCPTHRHVSTAQPLKCEFCADRDAYRRWEAKTA